MRRSTGVSPLCVPPNKRQEPGNLGYLRHCFTPVIPAVTRAQSRHAIGKRVLEPGTPFATLTQTLTSAPSCLDVFVRGQISSQPHTKQPKHKERCKRSGVKHRLNAAPSARRLRAGQPSPRRQGGEVASLPRFAREYVCGALRRCKREGVWLGWVPVGEELLRLPGAGAPCIHLLAGEEERRPHSLTAYRRHPTASSPSP